MTEFQCNGCRRKATRAPGEILKHYIVLPDSPLAKGYCRTKSIGQNPMPGGCLYPQYLSKEKREKRVKWERI